MKTILVTGGAGFIGSNFVHFLLDSDSGYKIVNLDALTYAGNPDNLISLENNPGYEFVKGSIDDSSLVADLFDNHDFDAVVHFAAESHVDRSITGPEAFVKPMCWEHKFYCKQQKAWQDRYDKRDLYIYPPMKSMELRTKRIFYRKDTACTQ